MYNYDELDYKATRQRSCYTPGLVYRYKSNKIIRGLMDDDLLLCIKKTGDCCYDFIRIERNGETSDTTFSLPLKTKSYYYKSFGEKHMLYGGMEKAYPNMSPLTPTALVHVLYSNQLLIPMEEVLTDEEKKELEMAIKASNQLADFHFKSATKQ